MLEVRLFAHFRDNRSKIIHLDHKDFSSPQSILDFLDIKLNEVAILLVNGRHAPADTALNEGDIIAFFPPVAGG
jgi:molybdopterin synthase sulfur carrier subunit